MTADTCVARAQGVLEAHDKFMLNREVFGQSFHDREFLITAVAALGMAVELASWGERSAQFIRTYTAEDETRQRYPLEQYKKIWKVSEAIVRDQTGQAALSDREEFPPLRSI